MAANALTFTRKSLSALEPLPKRATYSDTETRGLTLEVTPNGVKSFRVYRKVRGRPERITLGRFNPGYPDSRDFPNGTDLLKALLTQPELNVRMARRLADVVNLQIDAGASPAEAKRKARGELTLGQVYERYLSEHAGPHRLRAVRTIRQCFERYVGELPDKPKALQGVAASKAPWAVNWHNRKLSSITQDEVRRLHATAGRELAGSSANKIVDIINRLYRKAIDWGEFQGRSPAEGIKLFAEKKRDRFLKAHELPRFWEALQAEHDQDFKDYVLLSLLAGARSGNNLAMRYEDIDFQAAEWRVPGEQSKNGEQLVVVLVPEAMEILARRRSESQSPWVFPAKRLAVAGSGKELGHRSGFRKPWVAFRQRAGIADVNIHDLRRSLGSWQARTGASLLIIGKSLGHKSTQATQIYARLDLDPVREAVTRATSTMLSVARNREGEVKSLDHAKRKRG